MLAMAEATAAAREPQSVPLNPNEDIPGLLKASNPVPSQSQVDVQIANKTILELQAKLAKMEKAIDNMMSPTGTIVHSPGVRHSSIYDAVGVEIRDFQTSVAVAKQRGERVMETTQAVIDYFNPMGLGTAKHFIYMGVMVFPSGTSTAELNEMRTSMAFKLHGTKEAIMVGL